MRRQGVSPEPGRDPGAGSPDPGLRKWGETSGEHLLHPQAPAVAGMGVSEGLVAGPSLQPAGPWDSTDTLRQGLLKS